LSIVEHKMENCTKTEKFSIFIAFSNLNEIFSGQGE
jgi:hypothetical protein